MRSLVDVPLVTPKGCVFGAVVSDSAFRTEITRLDISVLVITGGAAHILHGLVITSRQHCKRVIIGRNHILHFDAPHTVMVVARAYVPHEI